MKRPAEAGTLTVGIGAALLSLFGLNQDGEVSAAWTGAVTGGLSALPWGLSIVVDWLRERKEQRLEMLSLLERAVAALEEFNRHDGGEETETPVAEGKSEGPSASADGPLDDFEKAIEPFMVFLQRLEAQRPVAPSDGKEGSKKRSAETGAGRRRETASSAVPEAPGDEADAGRPSSERPQAGKTADRSTS